jgi:hypothetical protein
MQQVRYLSAQLKGLKYEDCAEDFPVLEADALSNSSEEIVEDSLDELASAPDELAVSDQSNERIVVEEDGSLFLHKISHDVFTCGIEKEDLGIVPLLQVEEALFTPDFDDYLEEEQQSPISPFACQSSQTTHDSYRSESELDVLDFQEQIAEPYPLPAKENYHEEISHPEQQLEGQSFPMAPIYDGYESDPWESYEEQEEDRSRVLFTACTWVTEQSMEEQNLPGNPIYDENESDPRESQEEEKEPEEQSSLCSEPVSRHIHPMVPIYDEYGLDLGKTEPEEQNISCLEPVSKKLSPENNEPSSAVHHQPVLSRVIQPQENNCVVKETVGHQFSEICHSPYDPVGEYIEWYVSYALEPPCFISTSPCREKSKSVTILLSRLHNLLMIIDRRKELLSRKSLEWLWWKYAFT